MSGEAILTINAGSSSVKFSVFDRSAEPRELGRGQVESLGANARFSLEPAGGVEVTEEIGAADHDAALREILKHLNTVLAGRKAVGVGHRIVHGGPDFAAPVVLDDGVIAALGELERLAPLHQPYNLAGVRAASAAFPAALQVACFDTAFHRGHPWEHDTFALPQEFYERGVRRYGFHGLSYAYIAQELARHAPDLAQGRVIVAHLGNGASACAMAAGRSVSSTMGMTALDGLAMGTRPGQIDPGVLLYLMENEGMGVAELTHLLYRESGLKGLSGMSHDMRALLASAAPRAQAAIRYYVSRIRHEIGALAADLGGLDGLVFTGGVGENADAIRARVCQGLGWMGVELDAAANAQGAAEIGRGAVRVLVMPTDEEREIARAVAAVL